MQTAKSYSNDGSRKFNNNQQNNCQETQQYGNNNNNSFSYPQNEIYRCYQKQNCTDNNAETTQKCMLRKLSNNCLQNINLYKRNEQDYKA